MSFTFSIGWELLRLTWCSYFVNLYCTIFLLDNTCGETNFVGSDGVLTSSGWPSAYRNSLHCVYEVSVGQASGNTIALNFTHFDLEDQADCLYDYVQVVVTQVFVVFDSEFIY